MTNKSNTLKDQKKTHRKRREKPAEQEPGWIQLLLFEERDGRFVPKIYQKGGS